MGRAELGSRCPGPLSARSIADEEGGAFLVLAGNSKSIYENELHCSFGSAAPRLLGRRNDPEETYRYVHIRSGKYR